MEDQHEPHEDQVVETYARLLSDIKWFRRYWWLCPLIASGISALILIKLFSHPLYFPGLAGIYLVVAVGVLRASDTMQLQLEEYTLAHPWVAEAYEKEKERWQPK